ncbi:hypothetical protein B0H17DRAFT_1220279 [Mycena rosella]|uniref:Uncharacterized protein n=1 Tax=Mycena rosella TaxID=1033263 RepID=A0AAD7BBQ4_MYCRO|nr:hypothetical protein B0H17DRAFT_1220279 [Mycena rosella]
MEEVPDEEASSAHAADAPTSQAAAQMHNNHFQCRHSHSLTSSTPDDTETWNFDFGNELPDLDCDDLERDRDTDLANEVIEAPEIADEDGLATFAQFLSDAQEEARSAERQREKGSKRPKHYTKNSGKSKYRHRKRAEDLASKGYKSVFEFMEVMKKRRVDTAAQAVETAGVNDSMDEPSGSSADESEGSENEVGSPKVDAQPSLPDCMDPVNIAHVRLRELLEGLEDPSPESGADRALNQLNYTHFPSLRHALASLTIKSKDKKLDVFFRARITAMVGALNLYLDSELSYTWREASMIVSKSQGHGSYRARSIRSWIHAFLTSKKLPLHRYGQYHSSILHDDLGSSRHGGG